jgi:hypothetical protein
MIEQKIKLDWNDITIVPEVISSISSRSEINIDSLPLFVSPMDTVVDENNYQSFLDLNINVCLPRHIKYSDLKDDRVFYSYGLDEIISILDNNLDLPKKVLIDVANGHMLKLLETSKRIKENSDIELMVGNIANPETYRKYCEVGVDWLRCGIGGGAACFVEDVLVNTKSGPFKISEIKNGDLVLTHTGEYKEVINTISYKTDEELIKINENISTKDHEYYVLDKKYIDIIDDNNLTQYAIWLEASKIDINKHVLIEIVS